MSSRRAPTGRGRRRLRHRSPPARPRRASTSGTRAPARRRSPQPPRGRRRRRRRSPSAPLPRLRPRRREAAAGPLPISSSRRAAAPPRRPSATRSRTRSRSGIWAARRRGRSSPSSFRPRSPTPAARATAGRDAPARPLSPATSTSSPAISSRPCGSAASSAQRGRLPSRLSPRHSRPTRSRRTTRPASPPRRRASGSGGEPGDRPPHAPLGRHADASDARSWRRDRVSSASRSAALRDSRARVTSPDLDASDHTARGNLARGCPLDEGEAHGRGQGPARRNVRLQGPGRHRQADPRSHLPRQVDGRRRRRTAARTDDPRSG